MSERKILAFYSPYPGAGKSEAAQHIWEKYHFARFSFAEPLRRFVNNVVWGVGEIFDEKDKPLEKLNDATLRDLLIAFGMAGRAVYPDIWAEMLRRDIHRVDHYDDGKLRFPKVVIDDLRFPNEYKMLREEGAQIVRIITPGQEIIPSETEALLESYRFDAELMNDKKNKQMYTKQLDVVMRRLFPHEQRA